MKVGRPAAYSASLRERLMQIAAEAVDRVGLEYASLRAIASAAGTSTSAIYALFGSKGDLLQAIICEAFTSFGDSQAEAAPRGVRALGIAYRTWALSHRPLYRLMFREPRPYIVPAPSHLLPIVRALSGNEGELTEVDFRAAGSSWAHIHGAVSLELANLEAAGTDWDRVYENVLDSLEHTASRRRVVQG